MHCSPTAKKEIVGAIGRNRISVGGDYVQLWSVEEEMIL